MYIPFLIVTSLFEQGITEDGDNLYDLFSVVVHRGSAFGGHYFAYIRDIDNLGHWVNPVSERMCCEIICDTSNILNIKHIDF